MTDRFYNSYHFVPLSAPAADDTERRDADEFRNGTMDYGHDRYHDGRRCGRIVCRLSTESPIFIGAARRRLAGVEIEKDNKKETIGNYNQVEAFKFDGKEAIPPTSLKGMLSQIIEAATGSSMRVLDEGSPVSYRKSVHQPLSALGVLIQENNGWKLRPLALPTMVEQNGLLEFPQNAGLWRTAFAKYANFKIYDYKGDVNSTTQFGATGLPENTGEHAGLRGRSIGEFLETGNLLNFLKRKGQDDHGRDVYIAQNGKARDPIRVVRRQFRNKSNPRRPGKHNIFIPVPTDDSDWNDPIGVSERALTKFYALANERAASANQGDVRVSKRLPYMPMRGQGNEDWEDVVDSPMRKRIGKRYRVPKLRTGQIVYFDIAKGSNGEPVVSEFAFSQIWRDAAEHSNEISRKLTTIHDFVADADPELLPYHDERASITPAERLLGFVSTDEQETSRLQRMQEPINRAFKGHVRPSLGLCDDEIKHLRDTGGDGCEPELKDHTRLKILDSPKPPSPGLYFRNKDGSNSPIGKSKLCLADHRIQGRKMYLHGSEKQAHPWRTRTSRECDNRAKQKNLVRLLDKENEFWFHIDFSDLSEDEIALLCFALRPSDDFRHKIGMGKSIGLGSVKIDVEGLFLIDRKRRYTADDLVSDSRYHEVWHSGCAFPDRYKRETDSIGKTTKPPADRAADFRKGDRADKEAIDALLTIGEFKPELPVTSPLTAQQLAALDDEAAEKETFKWFAARDSKNGHRQQLAPISGPTIPSLKTR